MFKKNSYEICKKVISKEKIDFLFRYMKLKQKVATTLLRKNLISPFDKSFGIVGGDRQVNYSNSYACYGDIAIDLLLEDLQNLMEAKTEVKLIPTYTYFRVYGKGNDLKKHVDRFSCEFSTTLNIGGDPWPIYLKDKKKKTIKVNLKPGDLLIYKGVELEHWREKFKGNICAQIFLHYNQEGVGKIYDGREHLGIPLRYIYT